MMTATVPKINAALIQTIAATKGEVIGAIQYTHPSDSHLFTVLVEESDGFCVWTYNSETGGFTNGHYFRHSPSAIFNAVAVFCARAASH